MSEVIKWHQLKPQERDALIAEKVMGLNVEHWTESERETIDEDGNPEVWSLRTGYVIIDGLSNPTVSRYTSNMDAAWQVLEHIFRVEQSPNEEHFFAKMERRRRMLAWFELAHLWSMTATEAAEAICKAALQAVGHEIGD